MEGMTLFANMYKCHVSSIGGILKTNYTHQVPKKGYTFKGFHAVEEKSKLVYLKYKVTFQKALNASL